MWHIWQVVTDNSCHRLKLQPRKDYDKDLGQRSHGKENVWLKVDPIFIRSYLIDSIYLLSLGLRLEAIGSKLNHPIVWSIDVIRYCLAPVMKGVNIWALLIEQLLRHTIFGSNKHKENLQLKAGACSLLWHLTDHRCSNSDSNSNSNSDCCKALHLNFI